MNALGLILIGVLLGPGVRWTMRDMVAFHRNPPDDPFLFRVGWAGTILFVLVVGGCLVGIALS